MAADSLCFEEAHNARRAGEITLTEYLSYILAHMGCVKHEADTSGKWVYFSYPSSFLNEVREQVLDPLFRSLRHASKWLLHETPFCRILTHEKGIAVLQSMFLAGFNGDVTTVRKCIDSFDSGAQYYLRPLWSISLETGDAELLRLCFEHGFWPSGPADGYSDKKSLLSARVHANPGTAWLDVLFDFDIYRCRTEPQQSWSQYYFHHCMYMGADCTRWLIEHGASPARARGLFARDRSDKKVPDAPTMQVLLDYFGKQWFRNSGALQFAARKDDLEVVMMLINAGADVNEYPREFEWLHDYREGGTWASSALRNALGQKNERMIRYLVEQGAKLTLDSLCIPDRWNRWPKEWWPYIGLIVDLGAVEEEDSLDYAIFRLERIALE